MTASLAPTAQLTFLDDLPSAEQARVLDERATLDWDGLAASAGMTRTQLESLPWLWSRRGRFRTPYALLAAVSGHGHQGGPAQSLGQVLRRLGFTVNAKTGLLDKGNYHRVREAADYFGIELPAQEKDGPAIGRSLRHDEAAFREAWLSGDTSTEVAVALGQSSSGKTFARNRARAAELGLPPKRSYAATAHTS